MTSCRWEELLQGTTNGERNWDHDGTSQGTWKWAAGLHIGAGPSLQRVPPTHQRILVPQEGRGVLYSVTFPTFCLQSAFRSRI